MKRKHVKHLTGLLSAAVLAGQSPAAMAEELSDGTVIVEESSAVYEAADMTGEVTESTGAAAEAETAAEEEGTASEGAEAEDLSEASENAGAEDSDDESTEELTDGESEEEEPEEAASGETNSFVFSDTGIEGQGEEDAVTIDGTVITINAAGTYTFSGSCSDGSIVVNKGVTGVTLVLDSLSLTAVNTAPIVCKKSSSVTLQVNGTNTLTDGESLANEAADTFEGAAIKVKSAAALVITGSGTLNIEAGGCKNGIKGGASASILVNSAAININAANTALASDGSVVINGGSFQIYALNDGIKSEPEETDTSSAGTITINGGSFVINTPTADSGDAINGTGDVTIAGGTFLITAGDDAIHSDATLNIGTMDSSSGPNITVNSCIEGFEGATVNLYSGSGTIASSDDGVNAANSDLTGYAFSINIYGGTWYVDADGDGLDSNGDIHLYGGVTEVHGAENGSDANTSVDYEGTAEITGGTLFTVDTNGITPSGLSVRFGGNTAGGMGGGFSPAGQASSSALSLKAGDTLTVTDSSGQTIYSSTVKKSSNTVILAGDLLTSGSTYTLYVNGTAAASAAAGTSTSQNGMEGQMPGNQNPGMNPMPGNQNPGMDQMPGNQNPENGQTPENDLNAGPDQGSDPLSEEDEAAETVVFDDEAEDSLPENTKVLYRLYNSTTGEHLYTADKNERNVLVNQEQWIYEGIAWYIPEEGDAGNEVYRLFNPTTGEHLYTMDTNEVSVLSALGWNQEGIAWYSDSDQGVPVYRLFNSSQPSVASHHVTISTNEKNVLESQYGWSYEGIAWYGIAVE